MLDAHCHLDRYPNPLAIAREAEQRSVFTLAVTNLPSHFAAGLPHVRRLKQVRLALGLHPLAVAEHEAEMPRFADLLAQTSFVGEVGLDFSRQGSATMDAQLRSFRFVAQHVSRVPKVVSLHSRGAETMVLTLLREHGIRHVIFHWYSGPLSTLEAVVEAGFYLSVNPAMVASAKGRDIISRIPRKQVLTETDGPYVRLGRVPACPWDVAGTEEHLASLWAITLANARRQVWQNFQRLVRSLSSRDDRSESGLADW